MMKKAYVLYSNENYFDIVSMCAKSIRAFSSHDIIVYMINSDKKVDVPNTTTVRWDCNIDNFADDDMYNPHNSGENFYVNRASRKVYNLIIQRPLIVRDALVNYADVVVYVDCDSIATPYVDRLFDMYNMDSVHPYVTEGIYNYLYMDGRGGTTEKETLEYETCQLFGTDQRHRFIYRSSNIFVAGKKTVEFLEEWYWMCTHPKILKDCKRYAPFQDETILNVLLWKYDYTAGLPYVYVNADYEKADKVFNHLKFTYEEVLLDDWFKVPGKKEDITFFHGEKRLDHMQRILDMMIDKNNDKMRILFLAPHLSTGGMPAFLLKRIEVMKKFDNVEIYVVEFNDVSPDYVVQKNKIKELVPNFYTLYGDKMELMSIIKSVGIDVVHIDEMAESLGANYELLSELYAPDRTWRIVETCHNIAFNPDQSKMYHPDAYAFCTPYHESVFANMSGLKKTLEFPIDPKPVSEEERFEARMQLGIDLFKKHVINVGLWTPGKNQAEGLEIARRFPDMQFHFIGNQAPNFSTYWLPLMRNVPSNVKIWGERSDVDVFMKAADIFMFNSTWECNPLVLREAISYELPIVARDLPQYVGMFTPYIQPLTVYLTRLNKSYTAPTDNTSEMFGENHYKFYNSVKALLLNKSLPVGIKINQHFVEQPFLEITGDSPKKFDVRFYDENNNLYHRDVIGANHWIRLSRRYYTKWRTEIWDGDEKIYEYTLNLEGKRVFICLDSSSLGDTIAWLPYADEFRKKHKCRVIVSTFKNFLFKDVYQHLQFAEPGEVVPDIYAQYRIGWFYKSESEPALPNTVKLQQTATNILGLDYQEIRPNIAFTPSNKSYTKFVTIATNSTAGCKFWTKEGWQAVINYLVEKGYDVINVSKEPNPFDNCMQIHDTSMEHTMDVIYNCEFFIGLSSGLSWLAWAMNKKVVMISNFTEDNHEFECIRITNKSVCHGCWNKAEYKFDKGDWNWCPVHKGTDRQFECHTSITPEMVIEAIGSMVEEA